MASSAEGAKVIRLKTGIRLETLVGSDENCCSSLSHSMHDTTNDCGSVCPSNVRVSVDLGYVFFPPMPPHVLCGLRGLPSWASQECNRLLRLGRP